MKNFILTFFFVIGTFSLLNAQQAYFGCENGTTMCLNWDIEAFLTHVDDIDAALEMLDDLTDEICEIGYTEC